jgi:CysZ protein
MTQKKAPTTAITGLSGQALGDVFGGTLRGLVFLSVAAAIALLTAAVWAMTHYLIPMIPIPETWPQWAQLAIGGLLDFGAIFAAILLMGPVCMIVGGAMFDVAAERIEKTAGGAGRVGKGLDPMRGLLTGLRFAAVSIPLNILSLPLIFFGGLGLLLIVLLNAWLFGREYFSLAALRHTTWADTLLLRRTHSGKVFGAGLMMALVAAIPFLQFVTPLFGCALMVRLHAGLAHAEKPVP